MTEFELHNAGNSEAQQREALAYLLAQSSTGKATTGVLSGLAVSQTATASTAVLVAAGGSVAQAAVLDGASVLVNDTTKTLDVLTANPMGAVPRNDLVVFDAATTSIRAIIGTPNATPSDPTLPTSAVALARLRHAASATTIPAAKIDDLRTFTSLFGVSTQAQIDADSGWIAATLNSGWTNGVGYTTSYRIKNGRVEVRGIVIKGAGASAAFFTLPVGFRPASTLILGSFLTSGVGGASYDLFVDPAGNVGFASSGYVSGTTATGAGHPVGGSFLIG